MDRRHFLIGTTAAAVMARPLAAAAPKKDEASLAVVPTAADQQALAILATPPPADLTPRATLRRMRRLLTPFVGDPTLLRLWKNDLVVEGVRLIPDFFGMGHFRPATIALDPDGTVRMAGELAVP